jgi:hypothetical protein
MKRNITIASVLVVLLVILLACLHLAFCRKGVASECNYQRIRNGMTLEEVTDLMGPADEIAFHQLGFKSGSVKVVEGDRFFRWPAGLSDWDFFLTSPRFTVGMKDGKVCSKNMFERSL